MKKPSEIFEEKNSSLRKTFDEAVREEFQKFVDSIIWQNDDGTEKYIGVGNMADWWLERTISKADLLKWIENELRFWEKHYAGNYANGAKDAIQNLKKFISGE